MPTMLRDLQYAFRGWTRQPTVALIAICTLGFGVGVNMTVSGLVEALVLRPLPAVDDPDRVLLTKGNPLSYRTYGMFAERQRAFAQVAAWQQFNLGLVADGEASRVRALTVSPGYFEALGIEAVRGRTLGREDDAHPDQPSAVLSASFWRTRFGGSPAAVGRTVTINRLPVTIVGVVEKGFAGTDLAYPVDLFVPVASIDALRGAVGGSSFLTGRERHWLRAIGRLRRGVSPAAAQDDTNRTAAAIDREQPGFRVTPIALKPIDDEAFPGSARDGARRALLVLLAVAACVLLVACANVANLLLARGEARRAEFGIRLALGAGPGRLIRQLLTETLLVVVAAAAVGVVLTFWAMRTLSTVRFTAFVPVALAGVLDARVVAFGALVAGLTTIACGLAPSLLAARTALATLLRPASPTTPVTRWFGARDALVVVQIAASVILVAGAVLFVTTLRAQQALPAGFETKGVAFVRLNAALAGYSKDRSVEFFGRLSDRLRSVPQVMSVGRAINEPLGEVAFVRILARPGDAVATRVQANVVAPGYFATLGIALVEGRDFDERSPQGSVVVNEALARRLWPGRSAVGQLVEARDTGAKFSSVIGVARDSKYETLHDAGVAVVYSNLADDFDTTQIVFARTRGDARALLSAMRAAVRERDPEVPLIDQATMEDHVASSLSQARATAALVTLLAILAGVLAAAGLYGVLSFVVSSRMRDIAIRLALGAGTGQVLVAVGRRLGASLLAGLALGVLAAGVLGRFVSSLLYGISPTDPRVLAGAAAAAILIALVAGAAPMMRARRLPPASILRE